MYHVGFFRCKKISIISKLGFKFFFFFSNNAIIGNYWNIIIVGKCFKCKATKNCTERWRMGWTNGYFFFHLNFDSIQKKLASLHFIYDLNCIAFIYFFFFKKNIQFFFLNHIIFIFVWFQSCLLLRIQTTLMLWQED